jgi:hypothetical protein
MTRSAPDRVFVAACIKDGGGARLSYAVGNDKTGAFIEPSLCL